MAALEQLPTAYEILGVHPSAPTELISACYWAIARDLQEKRETEPGANAALHRLTRAYESVSDPVRRGGYNLSIGYTDEPLTKRSLPRRRFFLLRIFRKRHTLGWSVDPHEVLGLHPSAPQSQVSVAYSVMNDSYLRLPPGSRRRETLLNLLDESYAVLRDPQKRAQLAGVGPAEEHEPPPPAPDDPPPSDLQQPSQPDGAAAKVALPNAAPAPIEPSKPPKRALFIPREPVASTAGSRDGGAARRAAVAIFAFSAAAAGAAARGARRVIVAVAAASVVGVARSVRWVVMAVAATSVVVAGGIATAVHWAVLAVAALTIAAARFVAPYLSSAWLATRRWLSPSWEELKEIRERRSGDASSQTASADEVFLGRLASTVGKPRIEPRPSSDETTRR